jgi:hypothetical protein
MKKIITIFVLLSIVSIGNSTVISEVRPPLTASEIFLPVGNTGKLISLLELSQICVKDFEKLTGKDMKLFDKIGFKLGQKKLRKSINKDGTVNKKQIEKYLRTDTQKGIEISWSGLLLGVFLGPIGVLICYLINDDKKKQRVNWAWIGFAASVLSVIIVLVQGV